MPSLHETRASFDEERSRFSPSLLLPGEGADYTVRRSADLAKAQAEAVGALRGAIGER